MARVPKAKSIKIFYESESRAPDGTTETVKNYIHPQGTTLHAYVRQFAATEKQSADTAKDGGSMVFTINKRNVSINQLVEFLDKTYQITYVDNYEFGQGDIKFQAKEVTPKTYASVRYEG